MDIAQDDNGIADKVADGLGVEVPEEAEHGDGHEAGHMQGDGNSGNELPAGVKARLGRQEKRHQREMRDMHARIADLQSRAAPEQSSMSENPYGSGDTPPANVDEQIHKAVSYALGHRDREEQKAKQAQQASHVQKQYQELNKHLDQSSDKYDDFDDVVRGEDTPFTSHMRDAALLLDMDHKNPGSAGEVLYKLGKNPEELSRISKLHPLDQAREMVKLSKALISGGESKANAPRPLGQIKNTPVTNSHAVTEKTPIGNLRERMKQGNFK